jgi:hypothetical protein
VSKIRLGAYIFKKITQKKKICVVSKDVYEPRPCVDVGQHVCAAPRPTRGVLLLGGLPALLQAGGFTALLLARGSLILIVLPLKISNLVCLDLKMTYNGVMGAGWMARSVCLNMFHVWVPDFDSLQRDNKPQPS